MQSIWVTMARAAIVAALLSGGVLTIHEIAKNDNKTQQVSERK